MGACGCGADCFEFQFPGPDGTRYALEVYPGCGYCDTPVGVAVHELAPEGEDEIDDQVLEFVEDAAFENGQELRVVLWPEQLEPLGVDPRLAAKEIPHLVNEALHDPTQPPPS